MTATTATAAAGGNDGSLAGDCADAMFSLIAELHALRGTVARLDRLAGREDTPAALAQVGGGRLADEFAAAVEIARGVSWTLQMAHEKAVENAGPKTTERYRKAYGASPAEELERFERDQLGL